MNINVSSIINIEKLTNDYSAKIENKRICNFRFIGNGLYEAKCRSKDYADLFPVEYLITTPYSKTRNYNTYKARLSLTQLEKWINDIAKLGVEKRLDNRDKY